MMKPPYDPDALPPDLRAMVPDYRQSTINTPEPLSSKPIQKPMVSPCGSTREVTPKSYAQVAGSVSPPNPCGLKPRRKKRRNPLTVRLSKGEWEKIAAKAIRAKCTLNSYARAAMLGSDYTPPRDPELVRVLQKYYFELHMQGINLNQIAKNLNGGVISDEECEAAIAKLGHAISQMRDAVTQAFRHGRSGEYT